MSETLLLSPTGSEASAYGATVSVDAPSPDQTAAAQSSQQASLDQPKYRHNPLVTTRVGLVFVAIALTSLVCATVAHAANNKDLHSLMWIATISACALGGMLAMRSVRTLRTIELELRRATGQPQRWRSVRPIIGTDSITEGWNQLLEEISSRSQPTTPSREAAALDQQVVTLARAMRGLPVPWIITDIDGNLRFLSPAACALLSLSEAGSHVGRNVLELLGLGDPDEQSAQAAREQLLSDVRMVNLRREVTVGSATHHIRITRSRLDGRSGDGEGLAWILTDITQQQIAIAARDQFLMTATHELRTPLSNLHAYAEALQKEDALEIEQQKEFCNVIVSEAHRLGRLVDQLLTVGQMEAGSMVAHRHELEISPLVQYASDHVMAQAKQKGQTLSTELLPKLPTVCGDRDKLQAALVNLVGNAIKYTPEGGKIAVRCDVEDQFVRIEVEDDGPGIPESEQEKVFQQFYRGAAAVESDEPGNGLGLAFTREVVRIHGGDVTLASKLGEGSTFTMTLPIGGESRSAV
jgi:signal transduction histidine kinase